MKICTSKFESIFLNQEKSGFPTPGLEWATFPNEGVRCSGLVLGGVRGRTEQGINQQIETLSASLQMQGELTVSFLYL